MRRWSCYLTGVLASAALVAMAVGAGGETCQLEMKKVGDGPRVVAAGGMPLESLVQYTNRQSFFMQIGGPEGRITRPGQEGYPDFSEAIKKEPQYAGKYPFRSVVKLGSQYYGFAFDTEKPKEEEKKKDEKQPEGKDAKKDDSSGAARTLGQVLGEALTGRPANKQPLAIVPYSRLYFDLNHNGDLTDDKVIEATSARNYNPSYAQSTFPRADLTIEVDGKKVDYAFTMQVYTHTSGDYAYANGSLSAAAYRQGEITLDGKKRRVAVVDFNSNGRFDDQATVDSKIRPSDGTVYPSVGDMLYLIDPDAKLGIRNPYDPTATEGQHYVAKLVGLDGRFYNLTISPPGDTLSLEPSSEPVGYVTNPNKGYRALVYGDLGLLKIAGDPSGKAALPQGQWRLLSYTFLQTEQEKPKEAAKEGAGPERSLLALLAESLVGGARPSVAQQRFTMLSARAKQDSKPITVAKDQTTEMPFGPPYRPVVSVQYRQGKDQVSLSLTLVGSAEEVVNNLMVNGGQPAKPSFTITTEDGKEVASGQFEYG